MIDKHPDYPRRKKSLLYSHLHPEEVFRVEKVVSNIIYVLESGLDVTMDTVKCMC